MDVQDFISKEFSYAVVGASANPHKYGYTVLKDLSNAGFAVVGVNPKYHAIDGIQVYPTLKDVPGKIDVAIFVVPPDVGLSLLGQVEEKGIQRVWFQPGAESDEIERAVQDAGIEINPPESCFMVARRQLSL
ncbi:MAG: CoA-binding protein [Patescibacteria group bacterium]|jgi:hypothetical protein